MTSFEEISNEIINDPMNKDYTDRNILPLYKVSEKAKIVLVGQAPGKKAEESQMVWNDLSGDRLREWMALSRKEFYSTDLIAHLPMDFYYPGKAKSGDMPPRKGFAEKWHANLLHLMPDIQIIILIGGYAQKFYLKNQQKNNLTETVRNYQDYLPNYFPLVHPSPLNYGWMKKNPWFEEEVIPELRNTVHSIING